jgi:hypothetical protein
VVLPIKLSLASITTKPTNDWWLGDKCYPKRKEHDIWCGFWITTKYMIHSHPILCGLLHFGWFDFIRFLYKQYINTYNIKIYFNRKC